MPAAADPVRKQVETTLRRAVDLVAGTTCGLLGAARRTAGETVGLLRTVVNLTVDGLFGWDVDAGVPRLGDAAPPPAPSTAPPAEPDGSDATAMDGGVAVDLAIPGYEDLAASHIVARLDRLSPAELTAIRRFELAHRGRRTVVGKIDQLLAAT
jgi:hypothetical protein